MRIHHRLGRPVATIVAILAVALGATVVAASPAQAAGACQITYQQIMWPTASGYQGNIEIQNLADPINGWTLTFTLAIGQQLVDSWSAVFVQTSNQVTATSVSYTAYIPSGGASSIGFQAKTVPWWNPNPRDFRLNGVPCSLVVV